MGSLDCGTIRKESQITETMTMLNNTIDRLLDATTTLATRIDSVLTPSEPPDKSPSGQNVTPTMSVLNGTILREEERIRQITGIIHSLVNRCEL